MNRSLLFSLALAGASFALPALAEEQDDVHGWHAQLTPNLWAAGVSGNLDAGPLTGRLPPGTGDINVSFGDILSHLGFAFMGMGDVRYDRIGAIADINYVRISSSKDVQIANLPTVQGDTTVKTLMATFASYYRVYSGHAGSLDLVAGMRVNHLGVDITLSDPSGHIDTTINRNISRTPIDPIFGLRGIVNLTDKWSLTGYGDVGGAGNSQVYQLLGGVNYAWNRHWASNLAFRYYVFNVNANREDLAYHIAVSGPLLGVTYRF